MSLGPQEYDVVIVGGRVAGAALALHLGRMGHRVIVVDKSSFPSDTLSTHQIQPPGVDCLGRWGLLERVLDTGVPLVRRGRLRVDGVELAGEYPRRGPASAACCPRRFVFDALLRDLAARSGRVEFADRTEVEDVLVSGDAVAGVRARVAGRAIEIRGRVTVGADGRRSLVAERVGAPVLEEIPSLTCVYYAYFECDARHEMQSFLHPDDAIGVFPTNDGLTGVFHACPRRRFGEYKADVSGTFWRSMALVPEVHERLRAGRAASKFHGTAFVPNVRRQSFGQGWALVGDASVSRDPITGFGIGEALRAAEMLAHALDGMITTGQAAQKVLAMYQRRVDVLLGPGFRFAVEAAHFRPFANRAMLERIAQSASATSLLLGALSGSVGIAEVARALEGIGAHEEAGAPRAEGAALEPGAE